MHVLSSKRSEEFDSILKEILTLSIFSSGDRGEGKVGKTKPKFGFAPHLPYLFKTERKFKFLVFSNAVFHLFGCVIYRSIFLFMRIHLDNTRTELSYIIGKRY